MVQSRNSLWMKIPLYTCNVNKKYRWLAGLVFLWFITILILYNQKLLLRKDDKESLKYILMWGDPTSMFLYRLRKEQQEFRERSCLVNNCFIMTDTDFLHGEKDIDFIQNLQDFDAILFNYPDFHNRFMHFPAERSNQQKYVFVSRESPAYYPLLSERYDGFFNWTYTYKLNSDIYLGYIVIRNQDGDIIGPQKDMHWMDAKDMEGIDSELRSRLESKKLTAVWFVSNCHTPSRREDIALSLRDELSRFGLVLDIYTANCMGVRTKSCPKVPGMDPIGPDCLRIIETDYYFYLAFENSLSEDYVTEKLLHAVQHYTVPIVYGGANYSRFLPDGSYLDAGRLNMTELVNKIVTSTLNKDVYYDFFKWTNHYSYEAIDETPETDYMCSLCSALNDEVFTKEISVYENMRQWWNYISYSPIETKT